MKQSNVIVGDFSHFIPTSVRLIYSSVYEIRATPRSSLTYVHRSIGYHNPRYECMSTSTRLMYLSD